MYSDDKKNRYMVILIQEDLHFYDILLQKTILIFKETLSLLFIFPKE